MLLNNKGKQELSFEDNNDVILFLKEILNSPRFYEVRQIESHLVLKFPADIKWKKVQKELYKWLKLRLEKEPK